METLPNMQHAKFHMWNAVCLSFFLGIMVIPHKILTKATSLLIKSNLVYMFESNSAIVEIQDYIIRMFKFFVLNSNK